MKNHVKWEILSKDLENGKLGVEKILDILLENRGIKTKKEKDQFLSPDIKSISPKFVGINVAQIKKAIKRLSSAKDSQEQIIVYGDYDVDGITGTAILWETLNAIGLKVTPYIPSRIEEGYGLSVKGIENILQNFPETKIIITVDNGIVANEAVLFATSRGIDVIVTDHHTVRMKLPNAHAIIHTTNLCGAGVGWVFSQSILSHFKVSFPNDHLALVALATVADLVPLKNANRIILSEGLKVLHKTKRPGIVELCGEAAIEQTKIGVYEIGHILSPRLNAMGRISSAMDSLRLLCTKDRMRAKALAEKHGITNKERQLITHSLSEIAIAKSVDNKNNILFIAHAQFEEGVIGLVAGKLVEKYYRPSIVISVGEKISKASARSISGFNIIEFIRKGSHLLINAGGHPMAAGFTIETSKIKDFQKFVDENSKEFDESLLSKKLKIDLELPLEFVSQNLYDSLQVLQPFGMGNPEPTFLGSDVVIESVKTVGKDSSHLKLDLRSGNHELKFQAIGFNMGDRLHQLKPGKKIEIVYTIDENIWRDKKYLQLKIKDIKM